MRMEHVVLWFHSKLFISAPFCLTHLTSTSELSYIQTPACDVQWISLFKSFLIVAVFTHTSDFILVHSVATVKLSCACSVSGYPWQGYIQSLIHILTCRYTLTWFQQHKYTHVGCGEGRGPYPSATKVLSLINVWRGQRSIAHPGSGPGHHQTSARCWYTLSLSHNAFHSLSHTHSFSLSLSQSLCVSLSVSLCLSQSLPVSLSVSLIQSLPVSLLSLSLCLPLVSLCFSLAVSLSISLAVSLTMSLSISHTVSLSHSHSLSHYLTVSSHSHWVSLSLSQGP